MTKQFAIYCKEQASIMQHGFIGSFLVQRVPDYFATLEEAEDYIKDPGNKLIGKKLHIIEEHTIIELK